MNTSQSIDTVRLAGVLTRKELLVRYRGSLLGFGWILVIPIIMASLYTLVFWGIFKARWSVVEPTADSAVSSTLSGMGFGAQLFVGLVFFNFFADLMIRGSRLVLDHAALVKRVRFPRMALVIAMLMSSMLTLAIGVGIGMIGAFIALGSWTANVVALLFVALHALILGFGISLWVSSLSVYLRDLQQIIPALVAGLLFVSPVFYPSKLASGLLRHVLEWNPLSFSIEFARAAVFSGAFPPAESLLAAYSVGVIILLSGYWIFQRLQSGFADLI